MLGKSIRSIKRTIFLLNTKRTKISLSLKGGGEETIITQQFRELKKNQPKKQLMVSRRKRLSKTQNN